MSINELTNLSYFLSASGIFNALSFLEILSLSIGCLGFEQRRLLYFSCKFKKNGISGLYLNFLDSNDWHWGVVDLILFIIWTSKCLNNTQIAIFFISTSFKIFPYLCKDYLLKPYLHFCWCNCMTYSIWNMVIVLCPL